MSEQLKDLQKLFLVAMSWGSSYYMRATKGTIDELALSYAEKAAALSTHHAAPGAPQQEASGDSEIPLGMGGWLTNGAAIHPLTLNLVVRFARALAAKLAAAEVKYGYSDGWRSPDWMDECREKLVEHMAKGDPRDVAAYCAFLWHHGESTTTRAAATAPPGGATDALNACKAACERIIDQYDGEVTAGIDWRALLGSIDRALSTHHAAPGAPQQEASGDDQIIAREVLNEVGNLIRQHVCHAHEKRVMVDADLLERISDCLTVASRAAATAPAGGVAENFEALDLRNHVLERGMQALMARLASLLDEDQFKDCEDIVRRAGVAAPAGGVTPDACAALEAAKQYIVLYGQPPRPIVQSLVLAQIDAALTTTAAQAEEPESMEQWRARNFTRVAAAQELPTGDDESSLRLRALIKMAIHARAASPTPPTGTSADRYWTQPGESLMGIALRQLKDESRWTEIRDLNAASFPDMGPHDYYPVGTALRMPPTGTSKEGATDHGR